MNEPLVSICIPAYRAEKFLEATLESVRAQTYSHWELIVVEDGSHDRAEEIVAAFANRVTQPVNFFRHERNQGLPATRNTSITASHGEWIALLDSDDLWTPDHLTSLVETALETQADLVHAGSVLFDSDTGDTLSVRAPSPELVARFPQSLFTADYIIQPASVLLRRSLWENVKGFNPHFRYVEDREMWLRCARSGAHFAYTGRETCLYRKHAGALSTRAAEMAEASAEVFDQHLDWELIPQSLRRQLAAEAWSSAGRLRQRQDPKVARTHFHRACELDWRFSWWLRGALCAMRNLLNPSSSS
jgi:glycosyltransferase involved in cell wall biosynthesis